jgi:hypothetical protein
VGCGVLIVIERARRQEAKRNTQKMMSALSGGVSAVCAGVFGKDWKEPTLLGQPADLDETFDRFEFRVAR